MTCTNEQAAPQTHPGIFITFEGGEGSGKYTHLSLLARLIEQTGREVVCLREPGGTAIGEQLRALVLDPAKDEMADLCELFIYEAARAQLVSQVICPALERGAVVLCDRFTDSTVAYQAWGRGLDATVVARANALACQNLSPHRTIIMSAPSAAVGLTRAAQRAELDRLEAAGEAFHERVAQAFASMAQKEPHRMRIVESKGSREETFSQVVAAVADLLPELAQALKHFDVTPEEDH